VLRSARLGACAILAAGLLAACGKGTPLTSGTATPPPPYVPKVTSEYPVPTAASRPMGIVVNSSVNQAWFTENAASKIGILTQSGVVSTPEPLTPTAHAGPNQIASGPNGLMWFTETNVGKVGQIATNYPATITEFPLSPTARPAGITLGSDGNMWVTDPVTEAVWRVSQSGVVGAPCPLSHNAQPLAITSGSDGALWFTEPGINAIGRLPLTGSSACGTLTQYRIPTANSDPVAIVSGTDNALWFLEKNARKLGRMNITGQVTNEYSLSPATAPSGLVQGLDGNFYFTDPGTNQIGQFITSSGKVKMFKIPTANAQPGAMSLLNNQIYFVETAGNKIGQFTYSCC
jgi:virginiamycin B lyase